MSKKNSPTFPTIPRLNGIVPSPFPGCYDHSDFIRAEERDAHAAFLSYAVHVSESVNRSARTIERFATEIASHASAREKMSNCIDISLFLQRALEERGVWSVVIHGSVIVCFDNDVVYEIHEYDTPKYSGASTGHSWLLAPPFDVVDLTVKHQRFAGELPEYAERFFQAIMLQIPDVVLGKELSRFSPSQKELTGDSRMYNPHREEIQRLFPATVARFKRVSLKYIPDHVRIPKYKIDRMGLSLGGMRASDFYETVLSTVT